MIELYSPAINPPTQQRIRLSMCMPTDISTIATQNNDVVTISFFIT